MNRISHSQGFWRKETCDSYHLISFLNDANMQTSALVSMIFHRNLCIESRPKSTHGILFVKRVCMHDVLLKLSQPKPPSLQGWSRATFLVSDCSPTNYFFWRSVLPLTPNKVFWMMQDTQDKCHSDNSEKSDCCLATSQCCGVSGRQYTPPLWSRLRFLILSYFFLLFLHCTCVCCLCV